MAGSKSRVPSQPPKQKKMGRPSIYSQRLVDTICERIASGMSLSAVCRMDDMPTHHAINEWLTHADKCDFAAKYARARETRADKIVDEILEISDDSAKDVRIDPNTGAEMTDHEVVARSRLRVDSRKWIAARMAPKKYGDRVAVEQSGPDGGPIEHAVTMTADEAYRRLIDG